MQRPRLIERLHGSREHKLTLISAPAGFGKTTLLSEWLHSFALRAAWVSLDSRDNDEARFLTYLMAALKLGYEEVSSLAAEMPISDAQNDNLSEWVLPRLLNHMAMLARTTAQPPVIIVLDDFHLIENPLIHRSLAQLLDHLPAGVRMVLSSRTDPPLPLARLRARGDLVELRAQDLRFSSGEAGALLRQVSEVDLTSEQVLALEERTEGWAAGLQLAGLALAACTDIDRFVRAFAGSHRYILDYLADEAFYHQPDEVQAFLLQTSILDYMTAGLCEAVTGRSDAQAILEYLERSNVFVVSLDEDRRWYRYHHLFADLLSYRFRQQPADQISAAHERAAIWLLRNGQMFDAIGHALAAGNFSLAIAAIEAATPAIPMQGKASTLLTWLDAIPPQYVRQNPRFLLMYAWAHLYRNELEKLEPRITAALRSLGIQHFNDRDWPPDASAEDRDVLAQINALRVFKTVYLGQPGLAVKIGEYALSQIDPGPSIGRAAVLAALGDAYRDVDNLTAASRAYSDAIFASADIPNLSMKMDLVAIHAKMGNLRQAIQICEEVRAWGEDRHQIVFPLARANILLADLLRERNALDRAQEVLELGIQQSELGGYLRYLIAGLVTLARLHSIRGDREKSRSAIERAVRIARESGVEKLIILAELNQARLLSTASIGDLQAAQAWAKASALSLDDSVSYPDEDRYLVLARITLAGPASPAEIDALIQLLQRLLVAASQAGRTGSMIEILALQALAYRSGGESGAALRLLEQALTLAEPEGYVRIFSDEGLPMAELLRLTIQQGRHVPYPARLLATIADSPPSPGAFELTDSELRVLRLIDAGMANQEIADTLVISLNTVKTHITHLYSKLEVSSRTQAIIRAREAGLISAP